MATAQQMRMRRAKEEIQKAGNEISRLMAQLRRGTLDRKKLESGLRKLRITLGRIPPHHHYGPRC
jgi:hypothetical protein